jgi:hypothetical protein
MWRFYNEIKRHSIQPKYHLPKMGKINHCRRSGMHQTNVQILEEYLIPMRYEWFWGFWNRKLWVEI